MEKRMFRNWFDHNTKPSAMPAQVRPSIDRFDSAGTASAVGDQPEFTNWLERAGKI